MALTITEARNILIKSLVDYAATIGITINPNDWIFVPGSLSETDYKLLLLNAIATGMGFQSQQDEAFQIQQEKLISSSAPQTEAWLQNQMINVFQWNTTTPQLPSINLPNTTPTFNPEIDEYKVIKFCSVEFASAGKCLIHVAAESNGLPADLDTTVGVGALAASQSFANELDAPGISYVVSSGKSDWLFLQLDVYYNGLYSAIIFDSISSAITTFLNSLSLTSLTANQLATMKLSSLEDAILAVAGVNDVVFINVAGRPDANSLSPGSTTFGTTQQLFLVSSETENSRSYKTNAGYIAVENGTSTGGVIPNSQLGDFRVGSSGVLNLNCIAE